MQSYAAHPLFIYGLFGIGIVLWGLITRNAFVHTELDVDHSATTVVASTQEEHCETSAEIITPPNLRIDHVTQDSEGLIVIVFTVRGSDSNCVALATAEYSTTGAFSGEQHTLTDVRGDERNHGKHNLTSSSTGVSHVLVWDARAALPPGSDAVYFRFVAHDGDQSSEPTVFGPIALDLAAPVIANFSAVQISGTETVAVAYTVSDTNQNGMTTSLSVSNDHGASWVAATGRVTERGFLWDAGADFPNVDNGTVSARLIATDVFGNASTTTQEIVIDTKAPSGPSDVSVHPLRHAIVVSWHPPVSETHFDHYTIRYAANTSNVVPAEWSVRNDGDLARITTRSTVLTGLSPGTPYRVILEAHDKFGHVTATEMVMTKTLIDEVGLASFAPIVDTLPEITTDTHMVVSGTALPDTTIEIVIDDTVVTKNLPVKAYGEFSTKVTLTPGIHEIVVVATDASYVSKTSESQTVAVVTSATPIKIF